MNYEASNPIPVNGQRFLLQTLIACGKEPGDNILPLSVRLSFAEGPHDARRLLPAGRVHSQRLRPEPELYFTQW